MEDISIKKAATISMISKYITIVIQILINAVLSRILEPSEFGIIAIITVFTNFFYIMSDMGISSAIIQNKKLHTRDVESIFSFTLYLGVILGALFIIISFPISWIYNNSVYIPIGIILFFAILFNTLNMVPNALLLKQKQFIKIGIRTVVVTLTCGIISVILAFNGFSYYTLVFNSVAVALGMFLWNYINIKINFRWKYEKESLNKIKEFSTFQFAFSIVNYFSRNVDNLLIGKLMGNIQLAYYDKSYKLMLYPVNMLSNVITPVLHPILSEYQSNKDYIYVKYIKVVKLLSIIACFVTAFCFLGAREIVLILFGNNWENAVGCFKILSFSVFAQMISATSGSIYQSLGKTKLLFKVGLVNSFVTVISILIGVYTKNIENTAFSITLAYNFNFLFTFYILSRKGFNKKYISFLKEILPECIILIILLFSGLFYSFSMQNIILSALYKFLYLSIIYIILFFALGEWKYFKNYVKIKKEV